MTNTYLYTGGVLGAILGFLLYRFLKKKNKDSQTPSKQNEEKSSYTKTSDVLIDAWDVAAIEQLAAFVKQKGLKVVSVRKKTALQKIVDAMAQKVFCDGFDFSEIKQSQGVIVAVTENGQEDWRKIFFIDVKNDIDKLPDIFLLTDEGRYTQVERER